MSFSVLSGDSLVTSFMLIIAAAVGLSVIAVGILVAFYQRFWYERILRPSFDSSYNPSCAIIVPCKGSDDGLRPSIDAYLSVDYDNFEIIFAVESEHDSAVPVIKEAISGKPNAKLVVAGLSSRCAQKNWNMLKGVENANKPDVYVFADADITPQKEWLHELILPLSRSDAAATTGFRWIHLAKGSFGQYNHMFFNNFLYVLFCTASMIGNAGLWGGSMAMRREDFEKLGVAERWKETVVDDMSLAEIIMKNKKRSVLVPPCITDTNEALPLQKSTAWIERQMMFLKMYHTHLWCLAMPVVFSILLIQLWLIPAVIISSISSRSFFELGGAAPLAFTALDLLAAPLYIFMGRIDRFFRFIVQEPLLRWMHLYALARTSFTNTIIWSGVEYRLRVFSGKVISVKR
ncbi:MAG: glycosyltransferase [Chitinivibrionales bacterium]|nr:glycosyltransferase [Chitinivibrionales bacterium]